LAQSLEVNSTLTKLKLKDNNIGCAAIYLADALRINTTLTILDISNNELYDDGALKITGSLRNHPSIVEIDLSENKIGNKLLKPIMNNLIQCHLQNLHLAGNDIYQTQDISDYVRANNYLSVLNLSRNKIDNYELNSLSNGLSTNSSIKSLDLSFNLIDGGGLIHIAELLRLNSIYHLNLSGNNFSNGIKHLSKSLRKNTTLTSLNLSGTKLQEKGTKVLSKALKENKFLNDLNLSGNYIGNEGIKLLTDSLEQNTSLKKLKLNGNKFNQSGALLIINFLKFNTSITEINLSDSNLKIKKLKKIQQLTDKNIKAYPEL